MSHIFISYSKQNIDFARHLRKLLQDQGFSVWMDETQLGASEKWWSSIESNIKSASALVVILSPEARESDWVEREILVAEDRRNRIPIFPVLLSGEQWSRLANIQYEDMRAGINATLTPGFVRRLEAIVPRGEAAVTPPPLPGVVLPPSTRLTTRPARKLSDGMIVVLIATIFAIIVALIAIVPRLQPAADPTPTPTTISLVDMPTGVQINFLDTTATEIMLQRTVDAKETAISQSFAESTQIAATAHARSTATKPPPLNTTATQVIDFGATATEALLQRTVVAMGVINATLLAENTRIVQTSTLTATLSPTPAQTSTPATSGYPCDGTITAPDSSTTLYVVRADSSMSASLRDPIQVGQAVSIRKKAGTTAPNVWYEIAGQDRKILGWIPGFYVQPSSRCPI